MSTGAGPTADRLNGAGIGRVLEQADRVQRALLKVEARVEEGDERARLAAERGRLAAERDAVLKRAEAAEAEVAALADLVVAQEVELEDLREQLPEQEQALERPKHAARG
jgi:predicted nuclease with TOPRIM domain